MFRLKKNAELEKELLAQAPLEWNRFQVNKKKKSRGKSKFQQTMEDVERRADELRSKYRMDSPVLREIEQKYNSRFTPTNASKLVCPQCDGTDKGNVMNGEPFCFKCNIPLVRKGERNKIVFRRLRPAEARKRHLQTINPGLNPTNDEEP